MNKEEVVEKLKQKIDAGFTKTQIEELAGIPKNSLSSILSGKTKMSRITFARAKCYLEGKPFEPDVEVAKKVGVLPVTKVKHESLGQLVNNEPLPQMEPVKEPVQEEFDFTGETFFRIEKYTKFKDQDCPKEFLKKQEWKKNKEESDKKIRDAWDNRNNQK